MSDGPIKPKRKDPPPSVQVTAMGPAEIYSEPAVSRAGRAIPIGTMLGKYKIKAVLGHGGMGNVYAAEDPLIKRQVAIKVLPAEMARDPALTERLIAEAQAVGRLNHPHVVTMYDVDRSDGSYYIVMELITGGSVQDYLTRKGSPGWRAATRLIGEACKALVAAHEAGMIHRDIKPSNLMLTSEGHVKVADFGLAKVEAADTTMQTQPGMILGTPSFMSPEQCRGDKVDHRTDIYSLGCTYYALLTGKPPFEAASSIQMMFAHCSAPIPDPRELKADIPLECAEILKKALAKDPNQRYASAKDMLTDLRALLGGQTIAGGEVSTTAAMAALVQDAASAEALPSSRNLPPMPVRKAPPPLWMLVTAGTGLIALVVSILCIVLLLRSPKTDSVAKQSDTDHPLMTAPPIPVVHEVPQSQPAFVATTKPAVLVPVPPVVIATSRPAPPPATTQVAMAIPSIPVPPPVAVTMSAVATQPSKPAVPAVVVPPAPQLPASITNSIDEKLVLVPAGKFIMGDAKLMDAPPHEVTLTKPFYMGIYEVTQGDFKKVMGSDVLPPMAKNVPEELPTAFATWARAAEFCRRLSNRPEEKSAGRVYRLPTEAQWEYACRAGTTTKFAFGDTLTTDEANFGKKIDLARGPRPRPPQPPNGNGGQRGPPPNGAGQGGQDGPPPDDGGQHPLDPPGQFPANAWGLCDMHGGVWEWCSDFYAADAYKTGPFVDPTGPKTGVNHVARGGCWSSPADQCASAYRIGTLDPATTHTPSFGFRIICVIEQQ